MRKFKFKLSVEDHIVKQYESGFNTVQLGRLYNVSARTILNIIQRHGSKSRCQSERQRKYKLNELAFSTINNDSAYWAGFMMADGCLYDKEKSIHLGLSVKDKEHIQKFLMFLESPERRITFCQRTNGVSIKIRSERLFHDLNGLGITPRKSKTAMANILLIDNPHFWRGVIDGDGCVFWNKHNKSWTIHLAGAKPLMEQYAAFVQRHTRGKANKSPALQYKEKDSLYSISVSGKRAISLANLLWEEATNYLSRKYELIKLLRNKKKFVGVFALKDKS